MQSDPNIEEFLSNYNQQVVMNALKLRKILFENLPGITEQIDSQAN